MKQVVALSLILVSAGSYAAQCRVDLKNQISLDGEQVEITQADGGSAKLDGDNNLYIHGKKIALSEEQQQALQTYREQMNAYIPQAKKMADESVALANDLIDDVAQSLDAPDAFDDV